jgi:hypothetical protein
MRTLLVLIGVVLAAPAGAQAAAISSPANGITVAQGQPTHFDWAWADDEYSTSAIVFTRSANPDDPIWNFGPTVPTDPNRILIRDCSYGYCSAFFSSNATVSFKGFTTGVWYWRLCNQSIYGEDDKCSLDTEIRSLVVSDGPDCNDGLDNDGDARLDWPYDAGCVDAADADETDPPRPQCDNGRDDDGDGDSDSLDYDCSSTSDDSELGAQSPPPRSKPEPLPRLTTAAARRYARVALGRRFRNAYRHGHTKRLKRCSRISRKHIRCRRASWAIGDVSYRGWIRIWYGRGGKGRTTWHYAYRIKRTNHYCAATGGRRCSKVYKVR